jgi:demethylmenaquinone methyltransferase/2-methoxy-6-polyprenyl-1,4-benzoquinol methylase
VRTWRAAHLRTVFGHGVRFELCGRQLSVNEGSIVMTARSVAQAETRVDAHPRVTVSRVSAERLPYADAFFDAVLVSDAFHHFADQGAATGEMARVLRPGGGMLILELQPGGVVRIAAGLERLLGEPAAFLHPHELQALMGSHGIAGMVAKRMGAGYAFLGTRLPDPLDGGGASES